MLSPRPRARRAPARRSIDYSHSHARRAPAASAQFCTRPIEWRRTKKGGQGRPRGASQPLKNGAHVYSYGQSVIAHDQQSPQGGVHASRSVNSAGPARARDVIVAEAVCCSECARVRMPHPPMRVGN